MAYTSTAPVDLNGPTAPAQQVAVRIVDATADTMGWRQSTTSSSVIVSLTAETCVASTSVTVEEELYICPPRLEREIWNVVRRLECPAVRRFASRAPRSFRAKQPRAFRHRIRKWMTPMQRLRAKRRSS